ncbi:MAG: glucokinase [Proteobacteria bacterium]|nr:glucokinase [Pseudomonadota bacterium]MBU1714090.1 glucokinase [Pseudomonadota bacterium]
MTEIFILAGDIGGTKTNLAIYSSSAGPSNPINDQSFKSSDYNSLESLVTDFLSAEVNTPISHACFGVAGPVVKGKTILTNLGWTVEAKKLSTALNIAQVEVINDLAATAKAIPLLKETDLHTLRKGTGEPQATIGVIGPGTGLGEAFLTWNGQDRYLAYASEGGHADFAPTNDLESGLLTHLLKNHDHVSYEMICSGLGLPNIYSYLKETSPYREPDWLQDQIAEAADPTPLIINAALNQDSPCVLCLATLYAFVRILGAETGNLALKIMATGGMYLAGGIPPRIIPALESGHFSQGFLNKGRMTKLLATIPVYVVLNQKAALLGAASYGFERYNELK